MSDMLTALEALAPEFVQLSREQLFDRIWQQPILSPRERSLITIAALTVLYRHEQLPFHLELGRSNGLSNEEIAAAMTHLAFYGGWPATVTGLTRITQGQQQEHD